MLGRLAGQIDLDEQLQRAAAAAAAAPSIFRTSAASSIE